MRSQPLSGFRLPLGDTRPQRAVRLRSPQAVRIGLLVLAICLYAQESPAVPAQPSWDVPPEADGLVNPVPQAQESVAIGSVIYARRCAVCHGETGQGDGPSSQSLGVPPANLRDSSVTAQPDGRLFWKISLGRGPMPSWDLVLSEEERWHVVNYLRAISACGEPSRTTCGEQSRTTAP